MQKKRSTKSLPSVKEARNASESPSLRHDHLVSFFPYSEGSKTVAAYLCSSSILEVVKSFVKAFVKAFVKSLVFLFLGSLSKTNHKLQLSYGQSVCNIKF